MFLYFDGAHFHESWSLKLQQDEKNLLGSERLYFYEVTLQYSCKKCNKPVVRKNEINISY